jgi:hypothetical protein
MTPNHNEDSNESRQGKHITPRQFNNIRDQYHTTYDMRQPSQGTPTYELPARSDPIDEKGHNSTKPQSTMVQQSEGKLSQTGFTGIFKLEHVGREVSLDTKGTSRLTALHAEDIIHPEHDAVISKTMRDLTTVVSEAEGYISSEHTGADIDQRIQHL